MNIILCENLSEKNKIDKNITELNTLEGTLKNETSILDPKILFSNLPLENLFRYNYIKIPVFKRNYFIQDIVNVKNNLWEITAHVDVLSSYANQIKEQTAVIKRQENKWNLYLDDGIFKTYQNPNILTKKFPSGFTDYSFILAVSGG